MKYISRSKIILLGLIMGMIFPAASAFAAPILTVNKATLDFTGIYSAVSGLYSRLSTISLTVSNSGDGSLNWSMAGNSNDLSKYIYVYSKTGTATCSGGEGVNVSCTGGSGSVTLNFTFTDWWLKNKVPGTYTTTLTFTNSSTSQTVQIPVTLNVVARSITPTFVYNNGYPINCSNSNSTWFGTDPDTCTIPNERPSSVGFSPPGVGEIYADPNFGSTVRVITPPRYQHSYASLGAMNKDVTLATVRQLGGGQKVVNTETGAVVADNVPGSDLWQMWSAINTNIYYYFTGTILYRYTVGVGSAAVRDFASEMGVGRNPTSGGQGDLSKDDWISFYNDTAKVFCIYDIPNNQVYCKNYTGVYSTLITNNAQISKGVDSQSGKRYAILSGDPGSIIFSLNVATNTFDVDFTTPNVIGKSSVPLVDWDPNADCVVDAYQECIKNGHDDTAEDANGIQYLVVGTYYGSPNAIGVMAYQLNKGKSITVPMELGGGYHQIYWFQPASGISSLTMNHVGCARSAPYCVITTGRSGYGGGGQGSSVSHVITGATNAANIKITTLTAHQYSVGNIVNIGGVAGNTTANGVWTVQSVVDANNFTINANGSSSGVFSAGYGTVGRGEPLSPTTAYQGEVIVFEIGKTNPQIRRLANHRSLYYTVEDGTNFGYWAIARGNISQDASKVLYDSNFGEPTQIRVVTVETGIVSDITAPTISSISSGTPTATTTTITWTTNEVSDTQVEYGLTTSYGSNTTLDSSLTINHSAALSSLSANTLYHYRVKSRDVAGNLATSSDQTFTTAANIIIDTTPPTISSLSSGTPTATTTTITWTTNEVSDTQVEYGTTTLYGSTTTLNTTMATSHSVSLSSLSTNTLYHYRVKSRDIAGNLATSSDQTFTTSSSIPADTTSPSISSISNTTPTTTSTTITWTTNEVSDTQVEYGLTTSYGSNTTLDSSLTINHSAALSSLSANTLYHYRVKSRDAAGNLATSSDQNFATASITSVVVTPTPTPSPTSNQAKPIITAPAKTVTPTPSSILNPGSLTTFTKVLNLKDRIEVKKLQTVLNKALGLSLIIDGGYGLKTKSAVLDFQKSNGLKADGIIGSQTRGAINRIILYYFK